MEHKHIIEKALKNFDTFQISKFPKKASKIIADFQVRCRQKDPFANIDVLFIQHHLGPFIGRLRAMIDNGMDPKRVWFIDIPYSTSREVMQELTKMGFLNEQITPIFDHPLEAYDSAQKNRVSLLMESLINRKDPKPLLVVDDGAYFIRYLNLLKEKRPDMLDNFKLTSVVEQTTRGHRYISDYGLDVISICGLSVVSIAKCPTKTNFEGPFIGSAVSRSMKNALGKERLSKARTIAVIGYGVVGAAVTTEISRVCSNAMIDVIDSDPEKRKIVSNNPYDNCFGYPQLRENQEYDIVLGCTGYNSFHLDQRHLLANNAVLASGSSAAIEFNRNRFIELANEFDDDEIEVINQKETINQGIHAPIVMNQENNKQFSFLNAGFPVNFEGKVECLPTVMIQSTHCLLYAASIQSLDQPGPGVNTINPADDKWIFERSIKDLANAPEIN